MNPALGGVASSVSCLQEELLKQNIQSEIIDSIERANDLVNKSSAAIIAHGLWQWPGEVALKRFKKSKAPYLVFPHGMLDPWFKKTYPFKHIKKQLYWWWKQREILKYAQAVCFTTEEERALARKTFFPYQANEVVTGIGVNDPPQACLKQKEHFLAKYPDLKGKRMLLYLGRFHPKKGVDLLIQEWKKKQKDKKDITLVLGGPLSPSSPFIEKLKNLSYDCSNICWTGMLEGKDKWTALRLADALILPSHQENFGMVVAEACSVGKPVLLTNKVNLWREIESTHAGIVAEDNAKGISEMLSAWSEGRIQGAEKNALRCFQDHLHVKNAARRLIEVIQDASPKSKRSSDC